MRRRQFTQTALALACMPPVIAGTAQAVTTSRHASIIPSTKESIPSVGLGTYRTFHVGPSNLRKRRCEVLQHFLNAGGGMVDSSPMYGLSEEVIGHCLNKIGTHENLFSASKVWTPGKSLGVSQMRHSQFLWGVEQFDLMQIHNLVDWRTHLPTLMQWRAERRIRYLGLTTSHGRKHTKLYDIMANQGVDFIQLTYNLVDREAESQLLPAAKDLGIAVIVNRPFRGGQLLDRLQGIPLPDIATQLQCETWAAFCLKFITSHPSVTCAIPATSNPQHLHENVAAGYGRIPDSTQRQEMLRAFNRATS